MTAQELLDETNTTTPTNDEDVLLGLELVDLPESEETPPTPIPVPGITRSLERISFHSALIGMLAAIAGLAGIITSFLTTNYYIAVSGGILFGMSIGILIIGGQVEALITK